eukprot:scaffold7668_cov84-Phaeocystis_antarctica.AAC.2
MSICCSWPIVPAVRQPGLHRRIEPLSTLLQARWRGGDNFGSQCSSVLHRSSASHASRPPGPRSALLRRCGLRCLPPEAKGVELRCGHHADKPRDSASVRPAEVRRHREKAADLEHTDRRSQKVAHHATEHRPAVRSGDVRADAGHEEHTVGDGQR